MSGASSNRFMIWVSRARVTKPKAGNVGVIADLAAIHHVLELDCEAISRVIRGMRGGTSCPTFGVCRRLLPI